MNIEIEAHVARMNKPKMDAPCNHCGWCCLTETCALGKLFTPEGETCTQLVKQDGKYYCKLASTASYAAFLHIGEGCNAITVEEKLEMLLAV